MINKDLRNNIINKNTSLKHKIYNENKINISNNHSKTIKNRTTNYDNDKYIKFLYNREIKDNITEECKNIFTENENNCAKSPITSIGIIGYYFNKKIKDYQFLLIRRKDSLGYVDFIRGKYQIHNKDHIMNLLNEMTTEERKLLLKGFKYNWSRLWGNIKLKQRYINEEYISKEKFNTLVCGVKTNNEEYNLLSCLKSATSSWKEPEWGFPKGRREYKEKELNTAIREFCEETGIKNENINIVYNILPFEEIFNGSNFKSYKHKYYLAKINMPLSNKKNMLMNYQKSEVGAIDFKTYEEAIINIRDYDIEKKNILNNVYEILKNFEIIE